MLAKNSSPGKKLSWIRSALPAVFLTLILVSAPDAWSTAKYRLLHSFTGGADGNGSSALIVDAAGNLYGTSSGGGAYGYGLVFKLMLSPEGTWTEHALYQFTGADDGAYPVAALIFDRAGNLYGTTGAGGSALGCIVGSVTGCGLVFKLMPNSDGTWTEQVLHQFNGNDGAFPASVLTFDRAGDLFGTTSGGGSLSFGVIFKLSPTPTGGWKESVIHIFGFENALPGSLTFASPGHFFGTITGSGTPGLVFLLTYTSTRGWTYQVLHQFTGGKGGKDGANPRSGLARDSAGTLYGTTSGGGPNGYGTVFALTPNAGGGWTEHVIHEFSGDERGAEPVAGLTLDAAGNLFGTTFYGGNLSNCSGGCGVAFKLTPNLTGGWEETVLHTFLNDPGAHPAVGLVLDTAGNLYGTSAGDSTTTLGSVFVITP